MTFCFRQIFTIQKIKLSIDNYIQNLKVSRYRKKNKNDEYNMHPKINKNQELLNLFQTPDQLCAEI